MRDPGRHTHATRSAALLAVAVALCAATAPTPPAAAASAAAPSPTTATCTPHRHADTDAHDPALASLIACLQEAARSLAGSPAAVVTAHPSHPAPPTPTATRPLPPDARSGPTPRLHLSLLNLPPPATLS